MVTAQPYSFEQTIADIQHKFGRNGILTHAELGKQPQAVPFATGIPELDAALGEKGIPLQALTLLRGRPTAGVTTVSYCAIAQAQQQGDIVAYVDCCHTFDGEYATNVCGVQEDRLLHIEPDDAQHGLSITRDLVSLAYRGLLVVDMGLLDVSDRSLTGTFDKTLRTIHLVLKRSAWTLVLLLPSSLFPFCDPLAALTLTFAWTGWVKQDDRPIGYKTTVNIQSHTQQPNKPGVGIRLYYDGARS
jgi:hypothetical protein